MTDAERRVLGQDGFGQLSKTSEKHQHSILYYTRTTGKRTEVAMYLQEIWGSVSSLEQTMWRLRSRRRRTLG